MISIYEVFYNASYLVICELLRIIFLFVASANSPEQGFKNNITVGVGMGESSCQLKEEKIIKIYPGLL
jgi:hypothetical protein